MDGIDTATLESLNAISQPERRRNQLGQEEFLELMVAQIRHQDPFEPMQNGEFIAQLAQFGTVSGIKALQNSFNGLSESLISNQSLQASNLIGRNIRIPSNTFELSESNEIHGAVHLPVGSEATRVLISNRTGNLVDQIELGSFPAGNAAFTWDGILSNGQRAPAGHYHIVAESIIAGQAEASQTLLELAVSSVTLGNGRDQPLMLNLDNGQQIDFEEVSQIL